jgi:glycosyltransferase involved in cell wall biosynthesis
MRVGLTVYGSMETRSGGFRYDRRLVEGLRAAGDTVEVVELPWRRYPRGLLDNLSSALRDRLTIDVDVMLQDELAHPSLAVTNRRLSYPVVSVVHHLRSSERRRLTPLYRAVERRYLDAVDGAVCNSHATRETVTELGALAAGDTVVAPPAGDHFEPTVSDDLIAARAREGPLQVVFVGAITPRKGLLGLVDALARVETDWDLTVVGRRADETYLRTVREAVGQAGVEESVRILGEQPDDALADIFRESHVLAVPSRYEGFGLVYLEAMGFGLPAIGTTAGGAGDVISHGDTGYLVAPGDRESLVDSLAGLGADREMLARMGQAARRRYERHPDWAETTERVRSFLARVVEEAPAEVVEA